MEAVLEKTQPSVQPKGVKRFWLAEPPPKPTDAPKPQDFYLPVETEKAND